MVIRKIILMMSMVDDGECWMAIVPMQRPKRKGGRDQKAAQ